MRILVYLSWPLCGCPHCEINRAMWRWRFETTFGYAVWSAVPVYMPPIDRIHPVVVKQPAID